MNFQNTQIRNEHGRSGRAHAKHMEASTKSALEFSEATHCRALLLAFGHTSGRIIQCFIHICVVVLCKRCIVYFFLVSLESSHISALKLKPKKTYRKQTPHHLQSASTNQAWSELPHSSQETNPKDILFSVTVSDTKSSTGRSLPRRALLMD